MLELSRLNIFYFISNFLILPKREPKTSAFGNVFVLRAVFHLLYSCFRRKSKCVLQTPTIAVFARNWSRADPNFAPFRWRIWLALSEFLFSQSECHVCTLLFYALNYLFSAPCYLKTAFFLANHNREIFSCILLAMKYCVVLFLRLRNELLKNKINNCKGVIVGFEPGFLRPQHSVLGH